MDQVIALLERALAILRSLRGSENLTDEEHQRPPVSGKPVKLAIIVGHNEKRKGALSRILGSEWTFNKLSPVETILSAAQGTNVEVNVFFRYDAGSYGQEMRNLARRVDAWNPDCAISLHFNAFRTSAANGTETLHTNSKGSISLAEMAQRCMLDCFGLNNRGMVKVSKGGRGAGFLYGVKAPAILLEPGFGTNDRDAKSIAANWPEFAKDLVWLVQKWNEERSAQN